MSTPVGSTVSPDWAAFEQVEKEEAQEKKQASYKKEAVHASIDGSVKGSTIAAQGATTAALTAQLGPTGTALGVAAAPVIKSSFEKVGERAKEVANALLED